MAVSSTRWCQPTWGIALGLEVDVEEAVAGNLADHVVEEAVAGIHVVAALPVQVDGD